MKLKILEKYSKLERLIQKKIVFIWKVYSAIPFKLEIKVWSFIISKYDNIQLRNIKGFPSYWLDKIQGFQYFVYFA